MYPQYKTFSEYFYKEKLMPLFQQTSKKYIFVVNNFPYNLKYIKHWIFWIKVGCENEF